MESHAKSREDQRTVQFDLQGVVLTELEVVARSLFDALGSSTADHLREFFRHQDVLVLAELYAVLDDEGRCYYPVAKSYCNRWEAEGGPHADTRPRRSHQSYDPYSDLEIERAGFDLWSDEVTQPSREDGREALDRWDDDRTKDWRGRLRGALRVLLAPEPASGALPTLVVGQLPAMVLVTLLENGPMEKQAMLRLAGVRKSDQARLQNLLTPGGDLGSKGFIKSERSMVGLLDAGRAEAEMQKDRGTKSLDQRTHDEPSSG